MVAVQAIVDTGATGHCVTEHFASEGASMQEAPGVGAVAANGHEMASKGVVQFEMNGLPTQRGTVLEGLEQNVVSVGVLADQGYTAMFDHLGVQVFKNSECNVIGTPSAVGHREDNGGLYVMDASYQQPTPIDCMVLQSAEYPKSRVPNMGTFYGHINVQTKADWVAFCQAAMGFCTVAALYQAAKTHLAFPGVSAEDILENPPKTIETPRGHLRQVIKGRKSTKADNQSIPVNVTSGAEEVRMSPDNVGAGNRKSLYMCYSKKNTLSQRLYTDTSGKYHVTSANKNNYVFFVYHPASNFIKMVPIANRTEIARYTQEAVTDANRNWSTKAPLL